MEDEFDINSDASESDLPVEKAAKKLMKQQEKDEKDAELELKTNIATTDKITLPSGQEIEKDILFCFLLVHKIIEYYIN